MNQRREIFLGSLTFLASFTYAVHQNWLVTDLLWSLWISSLILGYTYLLTAIGGMLLRGEQQHLMGGHRNRQTEDGSSGGFLNLFFLAVAFFITGFSWITLLFLILALISIALSLDQSTRVQLGIGFLPALESWVSRFFIALPAAIFLFGFFSFHFIFFHFGHSIFLNGFFPILDKSPFGETLEGTLFYFIDLIQISIRRYWAIVLLGGFSRLDLYLTAFKKPDGASLFVPYKNVARMHVTIFVLAFLAAVGISHYALYFVFIIYFMPLTSIWKLLFPKQRSELPPLDRPIE